MSSQLHKELSWRYVSSVIALVCRMYIHEALFLAVMVWVWRQSEDIAHGILSVGSDHLSGDHCMVAPHKPMQQWVSPSGLTDTSLPSDEIMDTHCDAPPNAVMPGRIFPAPTTAPFWKRQGCKQACNMSHFDSRD